MQNNNITFIFVIIIICLISSFISINKSKDIEGFDRVSARANLIGVDNYDNYGYTYLGEKFYKNPGTVFSYDTGDVDYNDKQNKFVFSPSLCSAKTTEDFLCTFYSRLENPVAYFAGDIYGTYGHPHYTWKDLHPYCPNQKRQGLLGW